MNIELTLQEKLELITEKAKLSNSTIGGISLDRNNPDDVEWFEEEV